MFLRQGAKLVQYIQLLVKMGSALFRAIFEFLQREVCVLVLVIVSASILISLMTDDC